MSTLLLAWVSIAHASAAAWQDVVTPTQEVSVGRIVRAFAGTSTITVRESLGGQVADRDVVVVDPASIVALQAGDTVIVHREQAGTLVVAAR